MTGVSLGVEVYLSLAVYFLVMLGISWYGFVHSTGDLSEYMLGGRKMGPSVTALSAGAALAGMLTGALTVVGWIYIPNLKASMGGLYEMVPGFILSLLAIIVVSALTGHARPVVRAGFDDFEEKHDAALKPSDQ